MLLFAELIRAAREVTRQRHQNKNDLSQDFLDGFNEGVAETVAFILNNPNYGASDVLELIERFGNGS